MRRIVLQSLLAAALCTAALAQEERPLIDLAACRLDDERVALRFKFEASPCWEVEEPVFGGTAGEKASATIPTVQVGEICTMNIVIYEYARAIPVVRSVSQLEATVTDPEGRLVGKGTAAIAEPGPGCEEPEAKPAP